MHVLDLYEQGTLPTVTEVCDDLRASIFMALQQKRSDEESHILVPIWELRILLDAAESGPEALSRLQRTMEPCRGPSTPTPRRPKP